MQYMKIWNARTGDTMMPLDPNTGRVVFRLWDGPAFRGYFSCFPGGQITPTTEEDYETYRKNVYGARR